MPYQQNLLTVFTNESDTDDDFKTNYLKNELDSTIIFLEFIKCNAYTFNILIGGS